MAWCATPWHAFEAALFEHTTNWGTYLTNTVLESETICVRQAAAGQLPPVLQSALDNELAFLQALCGLTLDQAVPDRFFRAEPAAESWPSCPVGKRGELDLPPHIPSG